MNKNVDMLQNDDMAITRELCDFIAKSPSTYHVIANLKTLLAAHGFTALSEAEIWNLEPGSDYFVTRGESSIIAFRVPEAAKEDVNFQIVAAHSDSPSFRIKENPEMEGQGCYTRLNVEKYGGMLCQPWYDRPLSIAGRVIWKDGQLIESDLVNIDRDLCLIPNVAIHMNRDANTGASVSVQTDMCPLFGDESVKDKGSLNKLLAQELDIDPESILSSDLYLYSRTPSSIWGANNEFFSSTKLDDLQCAWSAVNALLEGANDRSICVAAIFDNEEVGSLTMQGADSTFMEDTLHRISICLGLDSQEERVAIAKSFLVSADNAHAVHPAHPEKADPVNRPHMNQGPVVKFHAGQKYTSTAVSASIFREICSRVGVPTQTFANHSDQAGGSTLGNLSNAHVSLHAVDIGMAQLAMHSPYETAGTKDTGYLLQALTAFYRTHITCRDNEFILG